MFNKLALVVAHPDDEIVWFNSIVDKVAKIYICYLDSPIDEAYRERRLKLLKEHPLRGKIIALDAKDRTLRTKLTRALEPYTTVFTHNPWGEYGHRQHILVYSIVKELQRKYEFDLWVSGFSPRRLDLPTDARMIKIRDLYIKHNAWTLTKNSWPPKESFWQIPR